MTKSNRIIEGECVEQTPGSNLVTGRRKRYIPLLRHHLGHDPFWHALHTGNWLWPVENNVRMPSMDFKESGDKYVLTVEIPGVSKEDIDITISDNRINIKADNNQEKIEEGECYVCQERTSLNFHRSFEFPEEINSEGAGAKLENGVLIVDLPKREMEPREAVKKIEIK